MKRILILIGLLGLASPAFAQRFSTAPEILFSTSSVQAVAETDAQAYRSVSVHVVTQGGSSTVTWQVSDDGATWVGTTLLPSTAAGTSSPALTTTTAGIWHGPLTGRYFRLNVTGITSATTAGVVEFSVMPAAELSSPVSVTAITGTVTPGTAATQLGKAEDAGHTSADTGVFVLGVRNESTTQITSADLDYSPISVDAYGALFSRVDHQNRISCGVDNIAATLTEMTGCSAPAAGLSIYITDVIAQSTTSTAGQFLLRQGTGTNCGTGTGSVFPSAATVIRLAAPANTVAPLVVALKTPIKLTAANALCLLGVATNTVTAQVLGFLAP